MDSLMIPKLMVSTDEKTHLFLKSCMKAEYPKIALIQYMEFKSITLALELNIFSYFLQSLIRQMKRNDNLDIGRPLAKKS